MHFLCLLYYNTESLAKAAPSARAALGPLCAPHDAALKATGKVRILGSFAEPNTWVTIVPAESGPTVKNGQHSRSQINQVRSSSSKQQTPRKR